MKTKNDLANMITQVQEDKKKVSKEIKQLSDLEEKEKREWVDAHNSLMVKKAADENSLYLEKVQKNQKDAKDKEDREKEDRIMEERDRKKYAEDLLREKKDRNAADKDKSKNNDEKGLKGLRLLHEEPNGAISVEDLSVPEAI